MAIEIYKDTKVYIACPAYAATGGPELLHQLGYHMINDIGCEAYMYYYNFDNKVHPEPIHPSYKHYTVPYVLNHTELEDLKSNILIVPEIPTSLNELNKFSLIRKGIWFLSVDNFYILKIKRTDFLIQRIFNKLLKRLLNKIVFDKTSKYVLERLVKKYPLEKDKHLNFADFYLAQSYYALNWFKDFQPLFYLSDYLNKSFLDSKSDFSKKEDFVAYNPKKGYLFTKKLISKARDIKFVPIENMTRDNVIKTLQRAKVYIDFGNHPGKDRIPREAAILGCCVITNKRGSAAYFEDVPIPREYKFEDNDECIPRIIEKIKDCFKNFDERKHDFDNYREIIRKEPEKFLDDLKRIFVVK